MSETGNRMHGLAFRYDALPLKYQMEAVEGAAGSRDCLLAIPSSQLLPPATARRRELLAQARAAYQTVRCGVCGAQWVCGVRGKVGRCPGCTDTGT